MKPFLRDKVFRSRRSIDLSVTRTIEHTRVTLPRMHTSFAQVLASINAVKFSSAQQERVENISQTTFNSPVEIEAKICSLTQRIFYKWKVNFQRASTPPSWISKEWTLGHAHESNLLKIYLGLRALQAIAKYSWKVLKRAAGRFRLFQEFFLKLRDSLHTFIFGDSYSKVLRDTRGNQEFSLDVWTWRKNVRELVWHASSLINLHYK